MGPTTLMGEAQGQWKHTARHQLGPAVLLEDGQMSKLELDGGGNWPGKEGQETQAGHQHPTP